MSGFASFEDILAWQKARQLVHAIYDATCSRCFLNDFPLRDQLRRAGISIMLNIAEGHGRNGDRQFAQLLSLSRGSAAEIQSALYIALDQKYIDTPTFHRLYGQAEEVSRILYGLISYLKQKRAGTLRASPLSTPDSQH
jgi:four helix bundle protein